MTKEKILLYINDNIIDNNSGKITAQVLRDVLSNIVNEDLAEGLGNATDMPISLKTVTDLYNQGYKYVDIATPSITPMTITEEDKVFYIAVEAGNYTGFGLIDPIENLTIFRSDAGKWIADDLGIPLEVSDILDKFEVQMQNELSKQNDKITGLTDEINAFKDTVIRQVNEYKPITIEGNVTNAADEEDITSKDNLLKLKDRNTANGKGYKIIRRTDALQELQAQFSQGNTIYDIRYNFDLNGGTLTIPKNSILDFNGGGCIKNGTVVANNAIVSAPQVCIFDNVSITGKLDVECYYLEWFGAKGDDSHDDTAAWLKVRECLQSLGGRVRLLNKIYTMAPIDLVGLKNVVIEGSPSSKAPWKKQSCIRIIFDGEVGIRCTGEYKSEPTYDEEGNIIEQGTTASEKATAILLKDFYLDCNYKVYKGINCNYNVEINSVEVKFSKGDGIVLEATSYPVLLHKVRTFNNQGSGVRVVAQFTTWYDIDYLESSQNDGYGLHIEGGNTVEIKNAILQSNKRGGLLLKQRSNEEFTHQQFLGRLVFKNLYTEANGTLDTDDPMYDGNYAVKVLGLRADRSFRGKIDYVTFENCFASTSLVEGVSSLRIINSATFNIDWEKNIEALVERTHSKGILLGDYYSTPIYRYNTFYDKDLFSLTDQHATNFLIIDEQNCHGQVVGNRVNVCGNINYSKGETPPIGHFIMKINVSKYALFRGNRNVIIVGRGYILGTEEGVEYKKEVIIEVDDYSSSLWIRSTVGEAILIRDIPSSGILRFDLSYISNDKDTAD